MPPIPRPLLPLVCAVATVGAAAMVACGDPSDGGSVGGDASVPSGGAGTGWVPEVDLFAPGVVSTVLPEFAAAFTPTGDTVFFNRTHPDRSVIDLLWAFRTADGWSEPAPFPPTEGLFAIDPFVEEDGRLHLSMERSVPGQSTVPAGVRPPANLWSAARDGGGWADLEPLPRGVNSDSSEVFGTLTRDGLMLFSSRRDGERRVWSTTRRDGAWSPPVPVRFGAMDAASNPLVDPAGRWAVFAATIGDAPPDLHLSCRDGDGWGEPRRLPEPINSEWTEFAPGLGPDHLYFTSERPGVAEPVPDSVRPPGDLYRTPLGPLEALCP